MKKKRYEGTINSFRVGKGPATRRNSPSSSFLPQGNSADETKQSIQTPQARREITVGHIHAQALQTLLYDHIQFLPATKLTFDDESKMALIVRPRKALSIGEPHSHIEPHQVCGNAVRLHHKPPYILLTSYTDNKHSKRMETASYEFALVIRSEKPWQSMLSQCNSTSVLTYPENGQLAGARACRLSRPRLHSVLV